MNTYQGNRIAGDRHELGDDVHEDSQGEHHCHAWKEKNTVNICIGVNLHFIQILLKCEFYPTT